MKLIPISKVKFVLQKHSPELWVGAGIVSIIAGTVMACRASLHLNDIMDNHEVNMDELKALREKAEDYENGTISEEEREDDYFSEEDIKAMTVKQYKVDKAKITLKTAGYISKEYAPAALLIGGGIMMIITGHRILCKRNAALLAAYTTLEQSFGDYRSRVRERYGEEVEQELYSGTTYIDTTKTVTDGDGKKKKIKEKTPILGVSVSPYARFFDEANTGEWDKASDYNHMFLTCQQNQANEKLRVRGYLFLNEVYRMLGLAETPTGAICGWILPEHSGEEEDGDSYVEFIIHDGRDLETSEGGLLVDFNCQGVIYEKI